MFFTLSLIFHQILTKNQTFIFFLVPLLVAFSHIAIEETKLKKKNMLFLFLVVFCILVTAKYHFRFNEGRKFHELSSVDLSKSVPATKIHDKLKGLQWISPEYKNNVEQEINLINNIKNHLKSDKRKKMVVTNYSFFSIILNERTSNSLKGIISSKNNFKHNFYTHRPSREKPSRWSFESGEIKFNGEAIILKDGEIWHQYQTNIQLNDVNRVLFSGLSLKLSKPKSVLPKLCARS